MGLTFEELLECQQCLTYILTSTHGTLSLEELINVALDSADLPLYTAVSPFRLALSQLNYDNDLMKSSQDDASDNITGRMFLKSTTGQLKLDPAKVVSIREFDMVRMNKWQNNNYFYHPCNVEYNEDIADASYVKYSICESGFGKLYAVLVRPDERTLISLTIRIVLNQNKLSLMLQFEMLELTE